MSDNGLTVWAGIDPTEAELRLSNIRRREAELEEALGNQLAMQRHYPDSFAISLAGKSLESRRELLLAEAKELLRYRVNEPVRLSLEGSNFHDHSASIEILAVFLLRFQKLYSSVAQAIQTGPTLRGPIASALRQATELRLAEIYPSSFGMELYVPTNFDLVGKSLSVESLHRMFELLTSSKDEGKLMEMSGILGGRVTSHLRRLASHLSGSESNISLSWKDYTGKDNYWISSKEDSNRVFSNLKEVIHVSSSRKSYIGILGGGSLFKYSFELQREDDGNLIEGTMLSDLLSDMRANFGQLCNIDVDETDVIDRLSGEKKTYYILTGINRVENSSSREGAERSP